MKIEEVFQKESQADIITELKSKRYPNEQKPPKAKNSLLKKIQGYTVTETKTVYVDSEKKDESGKPISKIKEQIITKKHVPPSLGAIIHYQTKNEQKHWKISQSLDVTGKDGKDLFTNMTDSELEKKLK